jgi:tripartite-type tricarboxylate transporter receptor subunit TctC
MRATIEGIGRAVAAAALLGLPTVAQAQGAARFPVKPIRVVVPYPAGGPTDMTARSISPRMIEALGQQLMIDNRAGASTIIGTEIVARAPPDGHTLLLVTSTISMNPSVFRKLPYDVERDLVPVTQVIASPFAVLAHPALPVRTLENSSR